MKPIDVLVPSPSGYIHVEAFRDVAVAIHDGLCRLGVDSQLEFTSNINMTSSRIPLILGGHLLSSFGNQLPLNAIVYNLELIPDPENVDEGAPVTPYRWQFCMGGKAAYLDVLKRASLVLDYSVHNKRALQRHGVKTPIRILEMGFSEKLVKISDNPNKDIDVLFIGSISPRRQAIIDKIKAKGFNAVSHFGVYGEERDNLLSRAKVIVNSHYYSDNLIESVRISYYLANGLFVVSEDSQCPYEDAEWEEGVVFAPYSELADTCLRWLDNWDTLHWERVRYIKNGAALMRERPMASLLKTALRDYL